MNPISLEKIPFIINGKLSILIHQFWNRRTIRTTTTGCLIRITIYITLE